MPIRGGGEPEAAYAREATGGILVPPLAPDHCLPQIEDPTVLKESAEIEPKGLPFHLDREMLPFR